MQINMPTLQGHKHIKVHMLPCQVHDNVHNLSSMNYNAHCIVWTALYGWLVLLFGGHPNVKPDVFSFHLILLLGEITFCLQINLALGDSYHGTTCRLKMLVRMLCCDWGPVQKGTNRVPKAVLDRDPLPDWVRDLNYMYVRSHALQTPSQSRTGSAHCEVIFCSYCADWPMHGFTNHIPKEL